MSRLSASQYVTLACVLEATAPKLGNVHRGADFEDLSFPDFLASAVAVGPTIARAGQLGVGAAVWRSVEATQAVTGRNTNLGTILLLAPLAAVPSGCTRAEGIDQVLGDLSAEDAEHVYRAIRLAHPAGLGRVPQMDVAAAPPKDLLAAMRLAAKRDTVARQFTNGFRDVLHVALPWLVEHRRTGSSLLEAIVYAQVQLLALCPDSLIARKCGTPVAHEATRRAAAVVAAGPPGSDPYQRASAELDFWLRSDGHRRNPGTTADLLAAALFAGLRDRWITPPFR